MSKNITGDKMLCHLDRIVGAHRPITADVFLTNYCNNKCSYCVSSRWEHDGGAYAMRYGDFVQYAEHMVELGVEGIILTGGGEPTLCPDFLRICGWMEDQWIHYGINTNFNKLVFFKPDYIKISLDGWDEVSYERQRGVKRYGLVVDNIKNYVEWRNKNSQKTSVGVQMVCTSVDDVYQFYEGNKYLNVDYFSLRPMESTGGQYYKGKTEETLKIIEAIQNVAVHDERVTMNFKWHMLDHREKDCTAEWAQIAVNERGEVMYCCHKPYQIVGHILDSDIMEKKARAGTDMAMCDVPCRMTSPNMFVSQVQKEQKDSCFI